MKKTNKFLRVLIILVLTVLTLNSCGENSNFTDVVLSEPTRNDVASPQEEQQDFEIAFSGKLQFHAGNGGESNANGYYEIATNTNGSSAILYTDFATEKRIVLCNRPECLHEDDTCTAFVGNIAFLPVPIVQDDKLILLYPGWPNVNSDGGVSPYIEVRDLNGSNAKKIATFSSGTELLLACATDNDNIYLISNTVSKTKQQASLIKQLLQINLSSGEIKTMYEFPQNQTDNIMVIGAYEDALLLKRIYVGDEYSNFFDNNNNSTTDDWNSMIASQTHEIIKFTESTKAQPVASWGQFEAKGTVINDKCFMFYANGDVSVIELSTGVINPILHWNDTFTFDTAEFKTVIGNNVILDIAPENYIPGQVQINRYAINYTNGEMYKLNQTVYFDGITTPIQILAHNGENLVVISKIEDNKGGNNYSTQGNRLYTFAIITEENFLSNSSNFKALPII